MPTAFKRKLRKDEASVRNWNRLVKRFGTTKIPIQSIANLTYNEFMNMDGIGDKSFYQLNDLIVKAGYPPYNFIIK
jgi:DNA repair protein RadC